MRRLAVFACGFLVALSACSDSDEQTVPPVSTQESEALEQAASMLDEQRLPDGKQTTASTPQAAQEE